MKTDGWRITASKSLLLFGGAISGGQDRYRSSATIYNGTQDVAQRVSRASYSASGWARLFGAKLVGEIGTLASANIPTDVSFEKKRAGGMRTFGSLSVNFGL